MSWGVISFLIKEVLNGAPDSHKKKLPVSLRARDTFNSSRRSRESYRRERISWVCGEDGDHQRKGYLREAREPYTG